jgi:uncharacterized protein
MSVNCEEISFLSQGVRLRGGWYVSTTSGDQAAARKPCIVMAHGLGGTRASGLVPFAEHFAAAGFAVLCFDYRGFGESEGSPRQYVSVSLQLEDWHSAITYARQQPGVDAGRIALWGSSFSGGVVIAAAVRDGKIAAVSSQGGMLDGFASFLNLVKQAGPVHVAKLTALAVQDALRARLGHPRITVPVVGVPGSLAALTTPDSLPGYTAITPPNWNNQITLDWMLTLPLFRPNILAKKLQCPTLFCIAERDVVVPPSAVEDAARRAGPKATVVRYARGHFDIYVGPGFEDSVRDQTAFFKKHLLMQ